MTLHARRSLAEDESPPSPTTTDGTPPVLLSARPSNRRRIEMSDAPPRRKAKTTERPSKATAALSADEKKLLVEKTPMDSLELAVAYCIRHMKTRWTEMDENDEPTELEKLALRYEATTDVAEVLPFMPPRNTTHIFRKE